MQGRCCIVLIGSRATPSPEESEDNGHRPRTTQLQHPVQDLARDGNLGLLCFVTPIPVALDVNGVGTNAQPQSATDFTGMTFPGVTLYHQAWMRSPTGPCASLATTSAGLAVTWN